MFKCASVVYPVASSPTLPFSYLGFTTVVEETVIDSKHILEEAVPEHEVS